MTIRATIQIILTSQPDHNCARHSHYLFDEMAIRYTKSIPTSPNTNTYPLNANSKRVVIKSDLVEKDLATGESDVDENVTVRHEVLLALFSVAIYHCSVSMRT